MSDSATADSQSAFAKLDTSNYATWKFDMQALLQTKMLWRLISGQEIVRVRDLKHTLYAVDEHKL